MQPLSGIRVSVLFLAVASSPVLAQTEWAPVDVTTRRHGAAMEFDGRTLVMFGGNRSGALGETLAFRGGRWERLTPANAPSRRERHAMVRIPNQGVVLLFGGVNDSGALSDTWLWNGTNWSRPLPGTHPPARSGHVLGYDPIRRVVILFGGADAAGVPLDDTWEWDGVQWLQRFPASKPSARSGAGAVFDFPRLQFVVFGGTTATGLAGDTWIYDGTNWRLASTTGPAARTGHAMANLSLMGLVVTGGVGAGGVAFTDTHVWDGFRWQPVATLNPSPARQLAAFGFDSLTRRAFLACGLRDGMPLGDTWEFDGRMWTRVIGDETPPPTSSHALVFDSTRGVVLSSGGVGDPGTWTFDGIRWRAANPANEPTSLFGHVAVDDPHRGVVVAFDGARTLEWNGVDWSVRTTATIPPSRIGAAAAYDPERRRVVMFGGAFFGQRLSDTWEFDGTDWRLLTPSRAPLARAGHAMTFDAARRRIVLFGGVGESGFLQDTWQWDGTTWVPGSTNPSPTARTGHAMTFDAARERVVVFGGFGAAGALGDTHEWDGTQWTLRTAARPPTARESARMVFDTQRGQVVMFGGNAFDGLVSRSTDDTFWYRPTHPFRSEVHGTGCPGSVGVPTFDFPRGFWLGDTGVARLHRVAPTGAALIAIGGSRTQWNGLTLPLSLAPLGMPGCTLHASLDVLIPVAITQSEGLLPLTVPIDPWLAGQSWFLQAFVADATINAFGAVASDAMTVTLGAR
jgi:hypothetical protein